MREPRILVEAQTTALAGAANARRWALTSSAVNRSELPETAEIDAGNVPRSAVMLRELEEFRGTSTVEQWASVAGVFNAIRGALAGCSEIELRQARAAATPEDHLHAHKLIEEHQ